MPEGVSGAVEAAGVEDTASVVVTGGAAVCDAGRLEAAVGGAAGAFCAAQLT